MTPFLRTGKKRGARLSAPELEPVAHERCGANGHSDCAFLVALADDGDKPAVGAYLDIAEEESD